MKKILLPTLVLAAISAKAQTSTDNVTLNVKLNPIQTLVVNSAQKTVDLTYTTKADYSDGVESEQKDHLSVYSTGGFEIKAKVGADLTNSATSKTIAANTINITAAKGTDGLEATYSNTTLSTSDAVIVSSTVGGVDKNINITYAGKGADAYINNYIAGQNPTVYTTTVTYTINAK